MNSKCKHTHTFNKGNFQTLHLFAVDYAGIDVPFWCALITFTAWTGDNTASEN